ncbi:MAG: outer membrane beta-barrel protein [Elusimicrobia bacterium]|nr:outer membrane beta-barrel protein [Elusimicrobiota bacterium]
MALIKRSLRVLSLAVPLAGLLAAPSRGQETVGARIVGFQDALTLRVADEVIQLGPGSMGYVIPAGAKTAVLAGEAMMLVGSALVKAGPGAGFIVVDVAGQAGLAVSNGVVEATLSDGTRVEYAAGQFLSPAAAGAPSPAAKPPAAVFQPPEAVSPAAPAPAAQEAPPFDPLTSLANAMSKLARLGKPEFKVVVDIHPYYRFDGTYDSNIYMVPKDRSNGTPTGGGVVGSWITSNNVGLRFSAPINRRHALEGGYDLKALSYAKQSKTNDTFMQAVTAVYAYSGLQGVKGKLTEGYLSTTDPAFSELVGREQRFQNNLGAQIDVARSRLFVYTLEGDHAFHKYLNPSLAALLNRWEASGGIKAGILLQPKTRLYAAFRQGVIHYSAGRRANSRSTQVGLGLSGRFSAKLNGLVEMNVNSRRYVEASAAGPQTVTSVLSAVQLSYQPGQRTQLSMRFNRNISESTFGSNRYYVATGLQFQASHAYHRLTFGANAQYEVDRYPEAGSVPTANGPIIQSRRDDLYAGGGSIDWKLRPWMTLGIAYQRMQRFSIYSGQYNYADDRSSVNARLSF